MVSVVNKIEVPLFGIIYIVSLIIVIIHQYEKIDFGPVTLISWFIVIFGALGFICFILSKVGKREE
jgi:hypothetical protein